MNKLIQQLDKATKLKALNAADKSQIKPVLDLLKALYVLGLRPDMQQQTVVAIRVKAAVDVLDYVGHGDQATSLQLAYFEI